MCCPGIFIPPAWLTNGSDKVLSLHDSIFLEGYLCGNPRYGLMPLTRKLQLIRAEKTVSWAFSDIVIGI